MYSFDEAWEVMNRRVNKIVDIEVNHIKLNYPLAWWFTYEGYKVYCPDCPWVSLCDDSDLEELL